MNVGQLKDALARVPDDAEVLLKIHNSDLEALVALQVVMKTREGKLAICLWGDADDPDGDDA